MKTSVLIFFLIFLASCATTQKKPNKIAPFKSDGCSMSPDGIPLVDSNLWVHCCFVHDISYWAGGEIELRETADKELGRCVAKESSKVQGEIMFEGTHIGGVPNDIFPWAWGYGWRQNMGYHKLSEKELIQVFEQFDSILKEIQRWKHDLTDVQKAYITERFQSLRHKLQEETKAPH
jgi:hypothetical protein